jgi:hypothetical protein
MPLISLVTRENIRNTLYHLGKVEEKRKWKACDSLGTGNKTKKSVPSRVCSAVKDYFNEITTQDREEKTICL